MKYYYLELDWNSIAYTPTERFIFTSKEEAKAKLDELLANKNMRWDWRGYYEQYATQNVEMIACYVSHSSTLILLEISM